MTPEPPILVLTCDQGEYLHWCHVQAFDPAHTRRVRGLADLHGRKGPRALVLPSYRSTADATDRADMYRALLACDARVRIADPAELDQRVEVVW